MPYLKPLRVEMLNFVLFSVGGELQQENESRRQNTYLFVFPPLVSNDIVIPNLL